MLEILTHETERKCINSKGVWFSGRNTHMHFDYYFNH